MKTNEIVVRSAREVAIGLFAFFMFQWGSVLLLILVPINSMPGILIAMSPIIPIAFVVRSIAQLLKLSDELQQRIQLLAIGFSAATTALLTFAYGILENAYTPSIYPPMPSVLILPLMVVLWIIGTAYFTRRFR